MWLVINFVRNNWATTVGLARREFGKVPGGLSVRFVGDQNKHKLKCIKLVMQTEWFSRNF